MADHDLLHKYLSYSEDSGLFHWKISPCPRVRKGDVAGTNHPSGYINIGFNGKIYAAHRLAWIMHNGNEPIGDIDHIDGNKKNNRIENLRIATEAQNTWNRKICTRNKSGIKGVSWYKAYSKWCAQIRKNGKRHFLGYFNDIKAAETAVIRARNILHGEFANNGALP